MTTSSARRQPSRGKAAGAGLLAPERPKLVLQGAYEPQLPLATEPDELEEVTVEPDLPIIEETVEEELVVIEEPVETDPAAVARKEYDRLLASMPPDEPVYVACNRAPRLRVGNYILTPGEVVPGAHAWPRRETYERLGRIERR